jgi:hypothetical protein
LVADGVAVILAEGLPVTKAIDVEGRIVGIEEDDADVRVGV